MANFTDIVFNTASQNPPATIYSLSADNNSVILTSTVGVYAGKQVTGILFNKISTAGTATISLSAIDGITFKVASDYDGAQMALYLADRSSVLFTVVTGTTLQTVTNTPSTNLGPIERRLRALEII
jgi:hypothetical protein